MQCRNFVLICLLGIFSASISLGRTKCTDPLIPVETLKQADLAQKWQVELPLKGYERIQKLTLLEDEICVMTSRNYLFCLNRNNGKVLFGLQVAPEGFPVFEPQRYGNELLIVAANNLMQVDAGAGTIIDKTKLDYTVICPVVRNRNYLYIAGLDDRIHALTDANKVPMFLAAADNGSLPTSVLAAENFAIFATDQGNILCFQPTSPQLIWQYDTKGKISAPLVRDNNDIYAASFDTRIYKFDAATGRLLWNFQLGGMPRKSPRVTADIIYQPVEDKGVTALNKKTGQPLWTVDDGIDLLAQQNDKAYIITRNCSLIVMDNILKKQILSLNFADAELGSPNTLDGKIYIADRAGRLACIAAE